MITMALTEKWGVTQVKVSKCAYTWKIRNFSYLRKRIGEEIESPSFYTDINKHTEWCLRLYMKGINENYKDYLSLYLFKKSSVDQELNGKYTLSIITDEKEKFVEATEECFYDKNYSSWGFPAFVKNEMVKDALINDTLTFHCEIAIVTGILDTSNYSCESVSEKPQNYWDITEARVLCNHMEKLYLDESFSDVQLIVTSNEKRQIIHAHKNILVSRSPIFAAMFEHDMVESKQSTVEIADVEYEVLKELLRFIYAARVENVEKIASGLLVAADKYQIEGLKDACEEILCDNITIDNAIKVLTIADRHSVTRLKVKALNFIKAHIKDVTESPAFESFEQANVLTQIIQSLVH